MMSMRTKIWGAILVVAAGSALTRAAEASDRVPAPTALELFEQRIMPIFKSPEPASCVQCHLAAVDLKNYILPSQEQTFASLRDQGLIDLAQPAKSRILALIQMGEKDLDRGARLIHEATRRAEYEAFAAWINACCGDPRLRDLPQLPPGQRARPARPDPVIRHARKSRVVDSFVRHVWSQRMRCFPCHTPHELNPSDPKLRLAVERHQEFLKKYGAEFGERMNIFRETPEATVQSLIEKSRRTSEEELPLINLDDPRKSLLVLKPTSKVPPKDDQGEFARPSYAEPVSHMGGLKMHVDDQSYKSFMAWIQDYARVVGDRYTSVEELPADNWFASKHVLMMRDVPGGWGSGARVQFFIHAWDSPTSSWSSEAVAFTQGQVTPARNVVGTLFLFGPGADERRRSLDPENAQLAPGKYLLKVYLDRRHRLAAAPTAMLGEDDLYGQAEIEAAWGEGFAQAEKVSGQLLLPASH